MKARDIFIQTTAGIFALAIITYVISLIMFILFMIIPILNVFMLVLICAWWSIAHWFWLLVWVVALIVAYATDGECMITVKKVEETRDSILKKPL